MSEDTPPWKAGDVVRLKPHASWLLPLRKYADEGRLADVAVCFKPAGSNNYIVRVAFRMKRKVAKQTPYFFAAHEVESAP